MGEEYAADSVALICEQAKPIAITLEHDGHVGVRHTVQIILGNAVHFTSIILDGAHGLESTRVLVGPVVSHSRWAMTLDFVVS